MLPSVGDIPLPALLGLLLLGVLVVAGVLGVGQEQSRDEARPPPEDLRAKHAVSLQKFLTAPGLFHGDVAGHTIDFLRSVLAEGLRPAVASRYQQGTYYRSWVARTDLPSAVTDYAKFVHEQIRVRQNALRAEQAASAAEVKRRQEENAERTRLEAERIRLEGIQKEAIAIVERNTDKVS